MDILFEEKRVSSYFKTLCKRLLLISTLALLNVAILGGCTGGWTKAVMTHSQLRTDAASCKFQVRRMVEEGKIPYERAIMKQKLNECLIDKGYQQAKEGEE